MSKPSTYFLILFVIATTCCRAQTPTLWGMTSYSPFPYAGNIFQSNASGTVADKHDFGVNGDGKTPNGSLIKASNGLLYGMTNTGGANNEGTIFSYSISTGKDSVLHSFSMDTTDGRLPLGSLIQASDSLLYGMTEYGGTNDFGVMFSYNITTGTETVLHNFGDDSDGTSPHGSLLQARNGLLYGFTTQGGTAGIVGWGMLFSYNISTNTYTYLYNFSQAEGFYPIGALIQANNGLLYGLTYGGGANAVGVIFSYDISKDTVAKLYSFTIIGGNAGYQPFGSLMQANNDLLYGLTNYGGLNNNGTIFSYDIPKDSVADLHDFGAGTDGQQPHGSLIQASDGLLYGTTLAGGLHTLGTLFNYNISTGAETDIHDFTSNEGSMPYGDLLEDNNFTTGVKQLTVSSEQLSVFPNPSSGQFIIKLTNEQNSYSIEVYNTLGQNVYQSTLSSSDNSIDLTSQPEGMYFIQVKSGTGVAARKILVTK